VSAKDLDLRHEDLGAYAFFPHIRALTMVAEVLAMYEDYHDVFSKQKVDELLELGQ
jgi:hypothetical protein